MDPDQGQGTTQPGGTPPSTGGWQPPAAPEPQAPAGGSDTGTPQAPGMGGGMPGSDTGTGSTSTNTGTNVPGSGMGSSTPV